MHFSCVENFVVLLRNSDRYNWTGSSDCDVWNFSISNRTEWSTSQGVLEAHLKLRARLLSELFDTRSNY